MSGDDPVIAEWSLAREDLAARAGRASSALGTQGAREFEVLKPRPRERPAARGARLRQALQHTADLQFSSIRKDLEQLLPTLRGVIADVGCGARPVRDLLAPEVAYIPVDIQDSELHFGDGLTDVRRFRGSQLPLADAEVTAVLCTETLEHVPDARRFLIELARALVPGGRLILIVPFAARWHDEPQDYRRYTPAGLLEALGAAGFRDIRIYARGGALAVASYKVLGVVLALWLGYGERGVPGFLARTLAVLLAPVAALAVLLGHLGLLYPGPVEDTLGYTVLAHKPRAVC